ncbi:BZ3501_MvSof-1269-A2-R1_C57g00318 [Microbotryum saponariae]|nr:BZ3501_MvSof-1269-A2-R1_C57g00318 [Microbotryum saponariae]
MRPSKNRLPLACEANVMDPSFTRAVRLVPGFIGQFAALSSSLVAKLTLPELDEDVDLCFIEDEIVPRVVICSASDLVHSALGFDATQFKRQAQDALARPGRSEVQVLFDKDCRRSPDQRVADWVLPLADFVSIRWIPSAEQLEGRTRRTAGSVDLGGGACRLQHVERHHFLTCCDELGSGNNGTGTHSMLVPLAFGPARMYAPGLAIRDDTAYFVVLDHEGCRIAIIPDCWGEGFGELASVLSVLLGLEVYSAGLSLYAPLVGRTVEFVAEEPVKLVDCRVAGGSSIFGRCTVIFELTRPSLVQGSLSTSGLSPSFVLKIQHINQKSKGCEADVLDKIVQCRTSHAPRLRRCSSNDTSRYPRRPRRSVYIDHKWTTAPCPYSWTRSILNDACESRHKLSQACEVFDQLLTLLPALWDLGIHHRDLSLGNVLHYQGHLVLVDWDTGIVAQPGTRVPIAADVGGSFRITDATASQEVLNYPRGLVNGCYKVPPHALRHDFESSVYWFLHGLQLRPLSNEATLPLARARLELWEGGYCPEVRQAFLEDLANVDSGLHDLVKFMTCAHPGSLPPFATGDRRHHRCVKQKMVQVQAELRRMLEGAQQPDYGGVLGRYHRLLKLQ